MIKLHSILCGIFTFSLKHVYLALECLRGTEHIICNKTKNISGVINAEQVQGIYTVLINVQVNSEQSLNDIISRIRKIKQIITLITLQCLVSESNYQKLSTSIKQI
ncbi:MAG: hypothetical protein MAG458_01487 [Nitrosopumilus sp.]|nr:hypothetical protein [Nitrosopumilus sp.]